MGETDVGPVPLEAVEETARTPAEAPWEVNPFTFPIGGEDGASPEDLYLYEEGYWVKVDSPEHDALALVPIGGPGGNPANARFIRDMGSLSALDRSRAAHDLEESVDFWKDQGEDHHAAALRRVADALDPEGGGD